MSESMLNSYEKKNHILYEKNEIAVGSLENLDRPKKHDSYDLHKRNNTVDLTKTAKLVCEIENLSDCEKNNSKS